MYRSPVLNPCGNLCSTLRCCQCLLLISSLWASVECVYMLNSSCSYAIDLYPGQNGIAANEAFASMSRALYTIDARPIFL